MAEKLMKYADATKKYDVVFGLETHVELSTNTKLFCPAHIEFGGEPNTELTPVSLGLPGSLPVINKTAVDYAISLTLPMPPRAYSCSKPHRLVESFNPSSTQGMRKSKSPPPARLCRTVPSGRIRINVG